MQKFKSKKLNISALEKRVMLDASLGALTSTAVFAENDANATPQFLDSDQSVTITGSTTDFNGDALTISTTGGIEDQLAINSEGTGAGQISISGTNVSYEGTLIGTISADGVNGNDLVIDLNVSASQDAIERLIENVTYQNLSDNPTTNPTINFALAAYFSEDVDVIIIAQNEAPTVDTNGGLTLNEGATSVVTPALLGISDPDNTDPQVTINITSAVTNGRLELTTNTGVAITSFTLDDLNNNRVQYVHDDSETTSDSFDFTVTDGSLTTSTDTFNITVNPVDEAPTIITNNGADVSLGFSTSLGGDGQQFGTEKYRESGVGAYTTHQGDIDNVNSMFTLVFTTDSTTHAGTPGQVLFEDGGSGRGIGLYLDSSNRLAWYSGAASSTPVLLSSAVLSNSTQYAVVIEVDDTDGEIRMHYQQAGNFNWFAYGRGAEDEITGYTDTNDLSGGDDGAIGVAGGGSRGGYNGSLTGTSTFQGDIDSDLIVYDFPTGVSAPNTRLVTTDIDDGAGDLIYTITDDVDYGDIRLNGAIIGLGDTFTQFDLDNGMVTYDSLVGNDDQFTFSLFDGTTTIAAQTYDIRVNTVNNAPTLLSETIIYDEDFEGGATGWNNNTTTNDGVFSEFLGRFNRNINVAGNQELFQSFALSGTQEYVTIEFDFYELDSWDNEYFYVFLDDTQILNNHRYHYNIYDREAGGTAMGGDVTYRVNDQVDGLGYMSFNAGIRDQVVTYSITMKTTDANLKLGFGSSLNGTNLNDEAFGIDNIRITELRETGADRNFFISELAPNNEQVGFAQSVEPDAGQDLTYSVTGGTGAGIFSVDTTTGEIRISDNSTLDFESGTTFYTLSVRATDNGPGLLFDEQTYTINVLDAFENNAPTFVGAGPFTVSEGAAVNDDVGTVITADAEGDTTRLYQIISGNGDGIFKINSTTGLIEVANTTNLDFDTDNRHDIRIRIWDDNELSKFRDQTIRIDVTDVDEAPILTRGEVIETENSGVYYSSATGNFYKLITANRSFNNALNLAPNEMLNGVAGHLVTVTSAAELAFVDQITPTHNWIALSDQDSEGNWVWMAGPEAGMQITRNGNVLHPDLFNNWRAGEPNSGNARDYALMHSNDLWYDNWTSNYDSVVEWEGDDIINNQAYYFNHSNPDGSDLNVGDGAGFVVGVDPEGADTLEYTIEGGNTDGIFEIDLATGEIRIGNTAGLDASVTDSYTLTIRATEQSGGKFAEIDVDVIFNDAFSITANNTLTVDEGSTTTITTAELNISDIDAVPSDTVFRTTTLPSHGRLELSTYPGYQVTSFTLDDLQNDRVVYVHDGTENFTDSFVFQIQDDGQKQTNITFNININDINFGPSIDTNAGATVVEGSNVTITQAMLDSSDPDSLDTPDQLTYTVSALANGHIEVSGSIQTTFTQEDINNGLVVFVHDGSEGDGSFNMSLADQGEDSAVPATGTFTITKTDINDSPTITTNTGVSVLEGGNITITTADLNATDPDDSGTGLTYTLSNISNGFVVLSTNLAIPVLSFTQDDLDNNRVVFRHDGNESDASFDVTLADNGENGATSDTATINVTKIDVNDAPVIAVNTGSSVNQNSIVILKNAVLAASDSDDAPAGITFTVDATTGGQVEYLANPNVAITSFTQEDINNSLVVFRHIGAPGAADFDFTVADSGDDGAGTESGTFTLTVDNVNDAPTITTNATPTMLEGATLTLTTAMLDSFDPDDFGVDLNWTATNLSNGILQVGGVTQNTFTQADLDAGIVTFIHDGGETTTAGFDIQVADQGENGAMPDTDSFAINVTPQNDAATLVVNDGNPNLIDFNATPVIPYDNFQDGQDGDPTSATASPDGTTLELGGNAWKKIDFTYTLTANTVLSFEFRADAIQEIHGIGFDNNTDFNDGVFGYQLAGTQTWGGMDQSFSTYEAGDGWVRFDIPVGNDFTGAIQNLVFVMDDDGSPTGTSSFRNVGFYESDQTLSINEGGTFNITTAHINSVDPDDSGTELTYTATNITNGHIEVSGSTQTTFTQDDLDNNRVTFVHDGTDTNSAGFDISLADGLEHGATADTGSFSIIVNPVDDAPDAATNNGVSLNEGATVTISTAELTTADTDTEPRNVVFNVTSAPGNGQLELSTSPGNAITSFTLADLQNNRVRYVHDGTETTTDAFNFTITDGNSTVPVDTFNIGITPQNDGAVIAGDLALSMNEGGNVTITTADLSGVDPDDGPTDITFTASGLSNGHIEVSGSTQNTFTLDDIQNNRVVFVHDGTETTTAGFNISLADGLEHGAVADTDSVAITVTPVDDAPTTATNNGATLNEGDSVLITTSELTTTDPDTNPEDLIFNITSAVSNGRIELTTNPGVAITSFTLEDIQNNHVRYVHDGTETTTDAFTFQLRDSTTPLTADTFNITVTPQNDGATITGDLALAVNEAGSVTITTTDLGGVDPDDANTDITYTASNITNGHIEVNGTSQSTFTLDDIINNRVAFIHDGSETTAAGFDISLADGLEHGAVADTGSITIAVTPVNDAPDSITLTNADVAEAAEIGDVVGTLSANDVDLPGDTVTLSILSDPDSKFILVGNELRLNDTLDYDVAATHNVTIRADDGNGGILDQIFTINVQENTAPTAIEMDNDEVYENSAEETWVGNLSAIDPDTPEIMNFTLMSNPGNMFMIRDNQLLVQSIMLDFETTPTIDIMVQVTDIVGNTFDQAFTINILDIAENSGGFIAPDELQQNRNGGLGLFNFSGRDIFNIEDIFTTRNLGATNSVLSATLSGDTFALGRAFYGTDGQIIRTNTTEEILSVLGIEESIIVPFDSVSEQIETPQTFQNTIPETVHADYTNIREALAFLNDVQGSEGTNEGEGEESALPTYDINDSFIDVLTYQERRQDALRSALSDDR